MTGTYTRKYDCLQGVAGAYSGRQGMCTRVHRVLQGVLGMCTGVDRGCAGDERENTGEYRGFSYGQGFSESVVLTGNRFKFSDQSSPFPNNPCNLHINKPALPTALQKCFLLH